VLLWLGKRERPRVCMVAETESARAGSRRAQFQLWIFSYKILVGSSKKCVSRVLIELATRFCANGH
jgi:hypothetical protein